MITLVVSFLAKSRELQFNLTNPQRLKVESFLAYFAVEINEETWIHKWYFLVVKVWVMWNMGEMPSRVCYFYLNNTDKPIQWCYWWKWSELGQMPSISFHTLWHFEHQVELKNKQPTMQFSPISSKLAEQTWLDLKINKIGTSRRIVNKKKCYKCTCSHSNLVQVSPLTALFEASNYGKRTINCLQKIINLIFKIVIF